MNFFCTEEEFSAYAEAQELDMSIVIKADIDVAVSEAKKTFLV